MDKITPDTRGGRLTESHVLREAFYRFGPKHGHAAYVSVAHLIGQGIYGTEEQWVTAHDAALAALDELREKVK